MIKIKVVYNSDTEEDSRVFLSKEIATRNPIFECYNENNLKQRKKAYAVKSAGGARECPFFGVFDENDKIIKGFYSEDNSATMANILAYLDNYVKEHAKKGYIKVTKIEGDETRYKLGATHEGQTNNFIEGTGVLMEDAHGNWFHTSVIQSIDWENKTFKTLNSTYKFDLNESN